MKAESGISFSYGNILQVNRKKLWADVRENPAPKKFETISMDEFALTLGLADTAILAVHAQMPEVFALRLSIDKDLEGRDSNKVLTPYGWDVKNSGVLGSPDTLIDDFHQYWEVVEASKYQPHVHLASGKEIGGAWLMLRNDNCRD